ncbi:hypothetical protein KCU78_g19916, partial [Aureobasidium melanogenum]
MNGRDPGLLSGHKHEDRPAREESLAGMSLIIYVAHSGIKIVAEPAKVNNLESLRAWVQRTAQIPVNKQVFLTSKGKAVRPQTLLTEPEIYVFDSNSFSPTNTSLSLIPDPSPLNPDTPPDS